jgi:hypothetical protein
MLSESFFNARAEDDKAVIKVLCVLARVAHMFSQEAGKAVKGSRG